MSGPERALIIRDPWVTEILSGRKTWELRKRSTNIRGRIGIIKAGTGCVWGDVDLVDCLAPLTQDEVYRNVLRHRVTDFERAFAEGYRVPWVLANPTTYATPRSYKHPPGAQMWVTL